MAAYNGETLKLAIVVRKDLGMRTGKIAGQVSHAAVLAYAKSEDYYGRKLWLDTGQKKIVLKVADEKDLLWVADQAELHKLPVYLVRDFGLTQTEPDSLTCVSIGPAEDDKIDEITGGLSLL